MEKILLDTDIGGDIDDAICLAYLLKEPQCELLGITTVCGEPEKRAAVADAICKTAGRDIPIVAGLDTTLQPVPVYPTPEGANALAHWTHNHFEKADAPAFMYQKIRKNPHEVILIGIGNMTNIATMFQRYPDAAALLKGLYVMNGYFGAERLPEPWYNWNSWADPLASQIVFATNISVHRAIPLEVTDMLTIKAEKARTLLSANSNLMNAVFDFGNAWLESSKKLTLHDPLAAVSIFYPDICRFQRGYVRVETKKENDMGATIFSSDLDGNVEVAVSVECEQFYHILSDTLSDKTWRKELPQIVVNRAKSAGVVGEEWLKNLDGIISELEADWNITVERTISGGTHAFVAYAGDQDGEKYVLKIDMPENLGGEFQNSIALMKLADGHGYPKVFAYDKDKQACLLECLGKPLSKLGYSVNEQIKIICGVLQQVWEMPIQGSAFPDGNASIKWFREFLTDTWENLKRPCSKQVISLALKYLASREKSLNSKEWVLLHGDAHAGNVLQALSDSRSFKFVDPDGVFYEKAYDLGVLMREWIDEYKRNPIQKGKERCEYLYRLTGVSKQAIWEWGYLQTVSTAFVLLQTGQGNTGDKMLNIAEQWAGILSKEVFI